MKIPVHYLAGKCRALVRQHLFVHHQPETPAIFQTIIHLKEQFMKTSFSRLARLISVFPKGLMTLVLLLTSSYVFAQTPCNTFVKEVFGAGQNEPRIFKNPFGGPSYYITATSNDLLYISDVDAAGTILSTQFIKFSGENGIVLTDMVVDNIDGELVGILRGPNYNYMFKYNYSSAAMTWTRQYVNTYVFQNIHQISAARYVATGEILLGSMTIFEIDRATGAMPGYQWAGDGGEFYSTYDGTSKIYGASRYYANSNSIFTPSLFQHTASTGVTNWKETYIKNVSTVRIYPVAPLVDNNSVLQLSSGDDNGFNTYLTGTTNAWLLSTNLTGVLNWTNLITISGYSRLNVKKIINTATGYYLLIDSYNPSSGIVDYFFVIKTDKSGNLVWANRYGISGLNTVIGGAEDNGYLYLTALSGSYTPGSNLLFLKLDANGMSDVNCGYITKAPAKISPYTNNQVTRPRPASGTQYSNVSVNVPSTPAQTNERIYCSTSCGNPTLPCNSLTGSIASGVLAFYPFGYGSLLDLSGNNNNLFNSTSAYVTPDRWGNPCAYHFDKVNGDYLNTPFSSFLNGITTAPFSVSLWYQPTDPTNRGVGDYELLVGRGPTTAGLHCPDTWGQWSVGLYDCRRAMVGFDQYSHWQGTAGYPNCSAQLFGVSNSWHHLAFVWDGTTPTIYVDGVPDVNWHGPCGFMSGNIDPLVLGADYTGDLDDIIIYNRALTVAEVVTLYNLAPSCCDGVTSSQKTSDHATDIRTIEEGKDISVYPNPTSGQVSISGRSIISSVAIYNNTGILVGTYKFNSATVSVNMNDLASGIYFIKVVTGTGSSTEKVIKE